MYYGEETDLSACLDEYEKLVIRMNKPRVVIDNGVCPNATVIKVDSARRQGVLLESIQILSDMNLSIKKAYISSDGKWNMDVFHVVDLDGNKLTDEKVISYIEKSIETTHFNRTNKNTGLTVLELTGTDRIGLLSEVFAVLSELQCSVTESKVWTHNGRIASLIYLKDRNSNTPITDPEKLNQIEIRLRNVLKWGSGFCVSMGSVHDDRRLHQMMVADRDYEKKFDSVDSPVVSVQNLENNGYSVVTLQCTDRFKLLFDVVCTLTDMEYVVFHAAIQTASNRAFLEFYIRHKDGTPISSEPERQRVIQCLQAAVDRRASQGVALELRTPDREGLLAEVTRTFRENGLNVIRSEISTRNDVAAGTFYVTDANGNRADPKITESVRRKIGMSDLKFREFRASICNQTTEREESQQHQTVLVSIGSLVRRNLYNLGFIKSYSF